MGNTFYWDHAEIVFEDHAIHTDAMVRIRPSKRMLRIVRPISHQMRMVSWPQPPSYFSAITN